MNSRPSASRRRERSGPGRRKPVDDARRGIRQGVDRGERRPGLQPRAGERQELPEARPRDVAQPEPGEQRVDGAVRCRPGIADVEVRPQPVRQQPVARPVQGRLRGVVGVQLALRGEERRPPAGPGRQLDDLAVQGQPVEPGRRGVQLHLPGQVVDGAVRVTPAAQVPVVVLAGARPVVGHQLGLGRGLRCGASRARVSGRRRGPGGGRRALLQGAAEPEAEERVLTRLPEAVRAEPRARLEVAGIPRLPGPPAPEAVEGPWRTSRPVRPPGPGCPGHWTGTQLPAGARSTNAAGSKISARSSIPSMTRGPGRLK